MEFRVWLEANTSMEVRIRDNPVVSGGSIETDKYRRKIKEYAGQWLPVEVAHLFGDQFNTAPPSNLRVMMANISDIKNDIRPSAAKCGWCGKTFLNVSQDKIGNACPSCDAWPMRDEAVIDRIRPLLGIKNGKVEIIYYAKRLKTIKTPEGDVHKEIL